MLMAGLSSGPQSSRNAAFEMCERLGMPYTAALVSRPSGLRYFYVVLVKIFV